MKINRIFLGLLAVATIFGGVWLNNAKTKVYCFDYFKVYDSISLRKELEQELKTVVDLRNSELDSLNFSIAFLMNKNSEKGLTEVEEDKLIFQKSKFEKLQQQYLEENNRLKKSYVNKIKIFLNKKSKDFAKENEIDIFFSAEGDGTIMYLNEEFDLTNKFIEYINSGI